jgi:benzoyl-CoA reductase/2-hydroxyglutaryl-CoA dehydratase subunit BcrC/BadD/HgdB
MNPSAPNPYRLPPAQAHNPGNVKKQKFLEEEQFRRLAETPGRPAALALFEERLRRAADVPKTRPRIGVLCNLVPVELILAAGAEAVRLDCGNSASAVAGEEILSGDVCPLAKATLGQFLRPDSPASACDALVVPATCDAKRKLAELLADYKPVFVLSLPPDKDADRHAAVVAAELRRLSAFIAKITGRAATRASLRAAMELTARRGDLLRRIQAVRWEKPRALTARDLFAVVQSSLLSPEPLETWLEAGGRLLAETEAYQPERRSLRPRLLLTGAPMVWPNFKVLNLLEECGADVVADTLCTGVESCLDPAVTDETSLDALLRALAARSIFGAICPCFTTQTTRIGRVLDLCEQAAAAGVVNYSLRLCQPFDLESYRLERVLKDRRIPVMNLRTDYSLEDTEQLRVRLEAFLETL